MVVFAARAWSALIRRCLVLGLLAGCVAAKTPPPQSPPKPKPTPPTPTVVQGPVQAPGADFQAAPTVGSAPLTVAFTDLSLGVPLEWEWDFGDGGASSEQNPAHVYAAAGTYTVSLRVRTASGATVARRTDFVRAQEPAPPYAVEYGMNSNENVWSKRALAFADGMARASEFLRVVDGKITPQLAPLIPLGEDPPRLGAGWPDLFALPKNERPGARILGSMAGTAPDGRKTPYVVTWEGTGSCRLIGPLVMGERNRTANRVEFLVDPLRGGGNGQLAWIMDSSDQDDPVRNVHVWLPGMETEQPLFWPPFVAKLRAMNGGRGPHTWRTLDWNQIRHYGVTTGPAPFVFDLAGRITPASPSQGTRRGVCPEFQVALCNELGANLHFLVPHQAEPISAADYEQFVRDALTVIRDGSPAVPGVNGGRPFEGLAPGLTVTLEYSNEIWNQGFLVNGWMRQRAMKNGVTFHEQIATEAARVFAIADEVFAGPEATRLRKFVGGWIADPTFLGRILDALPPGTHVDAVGPTGYFRPLNPTIKKWLKGASPKECPNCPTPEEVVEASLESIPVIAGWWGDHRAIASTYANPDGSSPALELYEAGASYIAGFQPWAAAASAAQSIPAMYAAYVDHLIPALVEEGVTLGQLVQLRRQQLHLRRRRRRPLRPLGQHERVDHAPRARSLRSRRGAEGGSGVSGAAGG